MKKLLLIVVGIACVFTFNIFAEDYPVEKGKGSGQVEKGRKYKEKSWKQAKEKKEKAEKEAKEEKEKAEKEAKEKKEKAEKELKEGRGKTQEKAERIRAQVEDKGSETGQEKRAEKSKAWWKLW